MLKNKIMVLAIGLLTLGGAVNSQTLRSDNGPAELPPASFKGKQYVDSKGCVYIKAGFGSRITWVPRVNRRRQVFCSKQNKPSLSPTQLAKISGKPATRVVKQAQTTPIANKAEPAATTKVVKAEPTPTKVRQQATITPKPKIVVATTPKATPVITQKVNRIPKRRKNGLFGTRPKQTQNTAPAVVRTAPVIKTPVAAAKVNQPRKAVRTTNVNGIRRGPQAVHPSDVIRQNATVIQGGTAYNIAATDQRRASSVRGVSNADRRNNRNAMRSVPQEIHPADVIGRPTASGATRQTDVSNRRTAAARGVDAVHGLTIYPSIIKSDVTARGDAQMALVWTNTVPRRLVKQVRAREVAQTTNYVVSTKSQPNNVRKSTRTQKITAPAARYIQVGTFGDKTNAGKTIRRFQARGFPVSSRAIKRKGQNLKVVFLGPFKASVSLQSAMRTVRGAGYNDAFYVK